MLTVTSKGLAQVTTVSKKLVLPANCKHSSSVNASALFIVGINKTATITNPKTANLLFKILIITIYSPLEI